MTNRCRGFTRDGSRCMNFAWQDNNLCWLHKEGKLKRKKIDVDIDKKIKLSEMDLLNLKTKIYKKDKISKKLQIS